MEEDESELRKELRKFRAAATSLEWINYDDKALCHVMPEYQAEMIIHGIHYKPAAGLLVRTLLAQGDLKLEDTMCPECGEVITKTDAIKQKREQAERILKEEFDSLDVTREVMMPLVKEWLEAIECYMVEQRYRLPKWGRPKWLKEIQGGVNKTDQE